MVFINIDTRAAVVLGAVILFAAALVVAPDTTVGTVTGVIDLLVNAAEGAINGVTG